MKWKCSVLQIMSDLSKPGSKCVCLCICSEVGTWVYGTIKGTPYSGLCTFAVYSVDSDSEC